MIGLPAPGIGDHVLQVARGFPAKFFRRFRSVGKTLGNVLASICYWGSCAAVGNASGIEFTTTVLPFLLRGINLLGIDSVLQPFANRQAAWARIVTDLPHDKLESMVAMATLADLPRLGAEILAGQIQGRTVIDLNT